jgi:L-alanine-DL-glutamate epimerase and related enzymes of enolase superfamily
MKLTFQRVELKLLNPWKLARTEKTSVADVVIVEIVGDDGRIGRGEAAPVRRYQESVETVEAFLRRVDPNKLNATNPEQSRAYLDHLAPGNHAAKCAVDVALWDLQGQRQQARVCDLLKLGFRENTHVTSFTIGIDTREVIISKVIEAQQFPILKMKVGTPADEDNLSALREVAPEKWIRLDANEGWATKEEAIRNIERLARDPKIQFVEQPMPANVPASDWIWLKERSPLPIFADESYHTAADAERAAECFHGLNVKLVKAGGISGAFDALQTARKLGLKTMIGCMIETSVLISAAAQLAELANYLDLDGNLLIGNDPFRGVSARGGILSFADAPTQNGLCVSPVATLS